MIVVLDLYNDVSQVLKKNMSGFLTGPQFTNAIKTAEIKAQEHFAAYFERTQRIVDAVVPFIKVAQITSSSNGVVALPGDFRHHIRLSLVSTANNIVPGGKPVISYKKMNYAPANAVEDLLADYIRKPNLAKQKFVYAFENAGIQIYEPAAIDTRLRYLRVPVFGKIGFTPTQTSTGTSYPYDPAVSNDLEWPEQVYPLIKYLVMQEFGAEVRDQIMEQYAKLEGNEYKALANIN